MKRVVPRAQPRHAGSAPLPFSRPQRQAAAWRGRRTCVLEGIMPAWQGRHVEAGYMVGDMIDRGAATGISTPFLRLAYANLQVYRNRQGQTRGPALPLPL